MGRHAHPNLLNWTDMHKIVMLVSVTLFSWLGWWLGEDIGLMTAFLLSSVASLVGVVVGWWINTHWLGDY